MKRIRVFQVTPALPERLSFLIDLSYNLWWAWSFEAELLFRRIDQDLWDACGHNPVMLLNRLSQRRYAELESDEGFIAHMTAVREAFERYLEQPKIAPGPGVSHTMPGKSDRFRKVSAEDVVSASRAAAAAQEVIGAPGAAAKRDEVLDLITETGARLTHVKRPNVTGRQTTWFRNRVPEEKPKSIAYFSAEFGLHESLPLYSGGLGMLAGDHLKSASDLGLPFVAIGLCYSQGYGHQYLNPDGWQLERYDTNDFHQLPMRLEKRPDGTPATVTIRIGERDVTAQIWHVQVGRVPLYLLDANVTQNHPDDRTITAQLYGGAQENRLKQEILLGIGGVCALHALGIEYAVIHMNEGHATFAALERIRRIIAEQDMPFHQAREAAAVATVFTTHTPVPAGNETYPQFLIRQYFHNFWPKLRLSDQEFLALGRAEPHNPTEDFGMTILALKLASHRNGVSKLHGQVSRAMWSKVWPELPEQEIPIAHVTNGVHALSYISPELGSLFLRYLGPRWIDEPDNFAVWRRVMEIPAAELWRTHERRRERLVSFARQRLREQVLRRGGTPLEVNRAEEVLDPDALTFGFARRFATYKRATLLLHDIQRMIRLIGDRQRPIQFIFAGKAHPKDEPGKRFIQQLVHAARRDEFRRHIVFLEDYDVNLARTMVQGVDVWLNTPRRPLEASGTSGMKASMNGALQLSVLDGWWVEGYNPEFGWAIGNGEEYDEDEYDYQDNVESESLYQLLESEVIPLFYARGEDGIPRGWVRRMQQSMAALTPAFNTSRMVVEYSQNFYFPGLELWRNVATDNFKAARETGAYIVRLEQNWHHVAVRDFNIVKPNGDLAYNIGQEVVFEAFVQLGALAPDEVTVEVCVGPLTGPDDVREYLVRQELQHDDARAPEGSVYRFVGAVPCDSTGFHGVALRVLPRQSTLHGPVPRLIRWG